MNKVFALVLLFLTFLSCQDTAPDSDFTLFREYITSFSSGTVSAHDDIRVGLTFSRSDWKVNGELDDDLFTISPSVKGKVILLPNNVVAFRPAEPLKQDQEYRITLHLSKVADVPREQADFRFSIKTIRQDFQVGFGELQSTDDRRQFLIMTLRSADKLDPAAVRKMVGATQDGQPLKIRVNASPSETSRFSFVVEGIVRKDSESTVAVNWDGASSDIDRTGTLDVKIPSKSDFKVVHVGISDEDNQSLKINFSNPLQRDQDFSGLVAVESASNLQYAVDGNVLKVFFEQPLDGSLLLEVFQGITGTDGRKLTRGYAAKVAFRPMKPQVRLLGSGTILPASQNLKLNFETVNLSKVDVRVYKIYENNVLQFLQDNELDGSYDLRKVARPIASKTIDLTANRLPNAKKWNAYSLDLSSMIKPEPGAIYRVEFSMKKSYSLYSCDASDTPENESEAGEEEEEVTSGSTDDEWGDYDYYGYYYDWSERENPCSRSYYSNNRVITNVLASNLGVIAKKGDNQTYFFAVNDITTTEPVAGADIVLYDFQKQRLQSLKTNPEGTATALVQKKAFFAVVRKGTSTTYLKLDDGNSQSLSNFDVSGGETLQKGLKGYIYGERGVWRPGDTLFLSFVLNDKASRIPASHPVKLRISDPNGKMIHQEVAFYSPKNHYVFKFATAKTAITGNYEARVSVGGAQFYKSLKIETIKPNRFRIKNGFANRMLPAGQLSTAGVAVQWLHGAPAKNAKIDVQARFSPQETKFNAFPKFVFDDPSRNFAGEDITLFSGSTDERGLAQIKVNPTLQNMAPGMLRIALITKAHEAGGDVSTDVVPATFSPYKTYVGVKSPDPGKYGMLETGKSNRFEAVAVDEKGRARAGVTLEARIYKVQWRWWWDASNDDLSQYSSNTAAVPYASAVVKTGANGRAAFSFKADENDWGRYFVRVSDPSGGHATGTTVTVDWPSWSRNMTGDDAKMLVFNSDKQQYNVGETAVISFPSSRGCRALISLENGSQVVKTYWAKTTEGETTVRIPVTSDLAPNVYVHITLLQPHAFSRNDAPIRLYGVIPIQVVDKKTILEPQLSMPAVLRPEQKTTLRISERQGRAMSYTIAIVDEGLLDLTRFKTPNPWDAFFAREALGVKTWDVYDQVIGAYGGKINQVFSIGGDAELGGGKIKKADRFKPVVMHLGPFFLKPGQTATHVVKLPKYVGSVRTMVVASNTTAGAFGAVEKSTPVKSPLMLLASMPRKITPGERVTVPVTIFAMERNVKQVSIRLKANKYFRISGSPVQSVTFAAPDEKMAFFELEALSAQGIGKVELEAVSGKEKASYSIEIDVENPNPLTHQISEIAIAPGKSARVSWNSFGVPGSGSARLELSALPPVDFNKRLSYLIQYPHGCIEQITSGVFPQLFLSEIADLNPERLASIQRNVTAGIRTLAGLQMANGGFAYWPGTATADDWGTSYAGHFLIEAEKQGYSIPGNVRKQWLAWQRKAAQQWRYYEPLRNDLPQAYRLYTLALAGSPDLAAMNRLRETTEISGDARYRLAAAYALAGQKNAASALLARAVTSPQDDDLYFGSPERNTAMQLETLMLLGRKPEAFRKAVTLSKALSSGAWMSTQTTAYSLMAYTKFARFNGSGGISANYTTPGKTVKISSQKAFADRPLAGAAAKNVTTVSNTGNGILYVRVLSSGILPVGQEEVFARGIATTTRYTDRKGNPVEVAKLPQGTEFVATITVRNQSAEFVDNLALSHIVPSGWEIVNTRFTEFGDATANNVTYSDIRDDRTNLYFALKAGEIRVFRVLLNASYPGTFYLPGTQCEAMYDNSYASRTRGQWVTVIRK